MGATLSYASGLPILAPPSTNNLNSLLFRDDWFWSGTFYNRNPGVPLFLKDLNCHCIDPTKDLVLNPAAWSNPAAGQWGTAAPYYNDYRYERRPSESMSFGRVFQFGPEAHPMKLTFRMNFTNILQPDPAFESRAVIGPFRMLRVTACTGGPAYRRVRLHQLPGRQHLPAAAPGYPGDAVQLLRR